jgi:hypothetical protein
MANYFAFAGFAGVVTAGFAGAVAGGFAGAAGFAFAGALAAVFELAGAVVFAFVFAGVAGAAGRAPLSSFGLSTTFFARKFSTFASFMAIA